MNSRTRNDVANALDVSIADVAAGEFDRLATPLSDQQIAEQILMALRAFEGLQSNKMPDYGPWDALFYLTWYQPSQINLAYTLARMIPAGNNPLLTGEGNLQVADFGCGALAMQFGLALAATRTISAHGVCPEITVESKDSSDSMVSLGRETWRRFVQEIGDTYKYPQLEDLRQACDAIRTKVQTQTPATTRWLTALHVAYEENAGEVGEAMDEVAAQWKPEVILVTARQIAEDWAYSPRPDAGYSESTVTLEADVVEAVGGSLEATTAFRLGLHYSYSDKIDRLAKSHREESISYFLLNQVRWNPTNFESVCNLYERT